jgi:hypothetical protein
VVSRLGPPRWIASVLIPVHRFPRGRVVLLRAFIGAIPSEHHRRVRCVCSARPLAEQARPPERLSARRGLSLGLGFCLGLLAFALVLAPWRPRASLLAGKPLVTYAHGSPHARGTQRLACVMSIKNPRDGPWRSLNPSFPRGERKAHHRMSPRYGSTRKARLNRRSVSLGSMTLALAHPSPERLATPSKRRAARASSKGNRTKRGGVPCSFLTPEVATAPQASRNTYQTSLHHCSRAVCSKYRSTQSRNPATKIEQLPRNTLSTKGGKPCQGNCHRWPIERSPNRACGVGRKGGARAGS